MGSVNPLNCVPALALSPCLISSGDGRVSRYFAHSLPGRPVEEWEPLEAHLQAVADLAGTFADKFGAAEWGRRRGIVGR